MTKNKERKYFEPLKIAERQNVQVQVVCASYFSTIGERSNVLDFPVKRSSILSWAAANVLGTPKERQLLGPWSLHEE